MRITTDNKWKPFRYRYEVPSNILADQFSHLTEEKGGDAHYFKYRGYWYHISDFILCDTTFPGWDGVAYDSAFSGVLLKIDKCGESYMVGHYAS